MMSEARKRKSKGPDFNVYVAVSFPNQIFCEIERLGRETGMAKAQLVRGLFLRGVAAYYRDGKLTETTAHDNHQLSSIDQINDEEVANLAA